MELALLYCKNARYKIKNLFEELWHNSDREKYKLARKIEKDEFLWLEEGSIELTSGQKEKINLTHRSFDDAFLFQ